MPPKKNKTVTPKPKKSSKKNINYNINNNDNNTIKKVHRSIPTIARLGQLLHAQPVDDDLQINNLKTSNSLTSRINNNKINNINNINNNKRLATIIHGTFLVTMAQKAQLGISIISKGITVTINNRWLESLIRYCGFTIIIRDIIECSSAFSEWLHVTLTVKPQQISQIQNEEELIEEEIKNIESLNNNNNNNNNNETMLINKVSKEETIVKLKLLRDSVPSVTDAEIYLQQRWGESNDWRNNNNNNNNNNLNPPIAKINDETLLGNVSDKNTKENTLEKKPNNNNNNNNINNKDEEYLSQISKELRASLSEQKLRAVVAQMKKDALGLDIKEQEEISKRQRRERLLSTYDLVRTLMGENRSICNISILISQLVAQNRFGDDVENILQQIASLVQYKESGITTFSFECKEEEEEEEEDNQNKNENNKEDISSNLKVIHIDVSSCLLNELEAVLLRWDRQLASRTALYTALQCE